MEPSPEQRPRGASARRRGSSRRRATGLATPVRAALASAYRHVDTAAYDRQANAAYFNLTDQALTSGWTTLRAPTPRCPSLHRPRLERRPPRRHRRRRYPPSRPHRPGSRRGLRGYCSTSFLPGELFGITLVRPHPAAMGLHNAGGLATLRQRRHLHDTLCVRSRGSANHSSGPTMTPCPVG